MNCRTSYQSTCKCNIPTERGEPASKDVYQPEESAHKKHSPEVSAAMQSQSRRQELAAEAELSETRTMNRALDVERARLEQLVRVLEAAAHCVALICLVDLLPFHSHIHVSTLVLSTRLHFFFHYRNEMKKHSDECCFQTLKYLSLDGNVLT